MSSTSENSLTRSLSPELRALLLEMARRGLTLPPAEPESPRKKWRDLARPSQLPPPGEWRVWLILAGRGWGKALALDTPLPTPSGWTTMGAVQVGDELFDEQGEPCRVTFATEVMLGRPCYEVRFSDGTRVTADAEHQWLTWTRAARKAAGRAALPRIVPRVVTTEEIRQTLLHGERERNHSVPVTAPVRCLDRWLPIDPYVLGVWLGDGSSAAAEITTMEPEVLRELRERGYSTKRRSAANSGQASIYTVSRTGYPSSRRDPNTGRFTGVIGGFHSELKRLGLLRNKHVPLAYLRASPKQRLELLQGLMDTDGSVQPGGHCEFLGTKKALAAAVFELAASLGLKPTWAEERARLYGKDCGPRFRVSFTPHIPVFRIDRKLARQHSGKSQKERNERRYIVAVEPVESVPVRCIQVDSPSHLFLCTRAFIPTHNTRCGAEWTRAQVARFQYVNLIGATADDARDIMVEGESGILRICPNAERPVYRKQERKLLWPNGAESLIFTADEPERLRGKQHQRLWMDELASWRRPEAYTQAVFGLRLPPDPRAVVTTTPKPIPLVKQLVADEHTAVTRGVSTENRENLDPAWFSQLVARYQGTRLGRQELEAIILDDNPAAIFRRDDIERGRVTRTPDFERVVVGVDPSGGAGEDHGEIGIVVAGQSGEHYYVLGDRSLRGTPQAMAQAVGGTYTAFCADRVVAEVNFGGEMVVQTLRTFDPNLPVTAVHASRGKQIRAEPIAALYEQGRVHHAGCFPELEDQMTEWVPGDRSPDRLDALVWALTDLSAAGYSAPAVYLGSPR